MFMGSKIVGDSQFRRGLLSSVLISAGVALLVFSSTFLLGGGLMSGVGVSSASGDLPAEAGGTGGLTLVVPSALPSYLTADRLVADLSGDVQPSLGSGLAPAPAEAVSAPPPGQPPLPVAAAPPAAPTPTAAPPAETPVPPSPTPVPTVSPPEPTPVVVPPTVPPPPPPPPSPPQAPVVSLVAFEADIFAGINAERVAVGLPALQLDPNLVMVARERSNDMAQKGYFAHVSPTGETAFTIMDRYGIPYAWAGENLARNNYPDDESVAVTMRDWMASQGHRDNILNPHYSTVGVGAAVDGAGMKYFTLVFVGF